MHSCSCSGSAKAKSYGSYGSCSSGSGSTTLHEGEWLKFPLHFLVGNDKIEAPFFLPLKTAFFNLLRASGEKARFFFL
jgi:hypothetical protein